jgi:serine/threonine-protein kinase
MAPFACPSDEQLSGFAGGNLSPAALDAVAAHLEACPHCQDRLAGLDNQTDSLQQALRRPVPTVVWQPAAPGIAVTPPRPAGETTVPPASADRPWMFGVTPRPENEIRALLHFRLRVVSAVGLVFFPFQLMVYLLGPGASPGDAAATGPLPVALVVALCVASAASFVLLWRRHNLSIRTLRVVELVLNGLVVAHFAVARYLILTKGLDQPFLGPAHETLFVQFGMLLNNFAWCFIILYYGVFIPNTLWRCIAVVGVMVLVPLAVTVAAAWHNPPVAYQLPFLLAATTMGLILSAALAVYGSFKIGRLQEEAFAARRLGPYQLKERLGAGGMGEVYLAEHRLLKRPCAIKLIRPERASDPAWLRRFEREVHATARLRNPNTVEIYDYGHAEDGTFYYVMEYLPGLSLQTLVERHGLLPPGRAIYVLRQLCRALKAAHAVGLVHRDIKPGNVLVCALGGQYDLVKLLDFGLVRSIDGTGGRLTEAGLVLGTPDFISPEQTRGADTVDGRSDLYSMGALAYFALTGHPPFVGKSVMDILVAHLHEPPPALAAQRPDVPADLAAVVERCLAKDPAERFPDAQRLEAALAGCAGAADWTEAAAGAWWHSHPVTPANATVTDSPA